MEKVIQAITKDGKVPTAILVVIWFMMEMQKDIKSHIDERSKEHAEEIIKIVEKNNEAVLNKLNKLEDKGFDFMMKARQNEKD